MISDNDHPIPTDANPPTYHQTDGNQGESIRLLMIVVSVLSGMAFIGLTILAATQHAWQLSVLAVMYAASAVTSGLILHFYAGKEIGFLEIAGNSVVFGLAMIGTSAFLAGMGLPAAIVYLIFILMFTSLMAAAWQVNLLIFIGILFSGAAALLSDFSPFEQLTIQLVGIVTPAILTILFMIYLVMSAMQFVSATVRVRMVTSFMAIVVIPLAILSAIQGQFMISVLTGEVNNALLMAAQQTAFGIDQLMGDSLRSVQDAAKLEIFANYLSLPKEQRANSPEDMEMRLTMRVLDTSELNSNIYISSYALIDLDGNVVYDTLADRVARRFSPETLRSMGIAIDAILSGRNSYEGAEPYFRIPAQTGTTYLSQLRIANSTRSFFFISAPVKDQQGRVLGVLRARYDGLLLQDLLKSYNGLVGQHSYAILVDEYNIRLADAYTPNYLYKSVAPLPADQIQQLKSVRRLPDLPNAMLSTNFTELETFLNSFDSVSPFFQADLSPTSTTTKQNQIGAVSKVRSMPWKVIYLRTDYSDEELRAEQRRLTTLVTVIIAGVVGMVAVGLSQLLSSPIIKLTETARKISSGDLEARASVESKDEFGMLGAAFNSMTGQLRALISQLEERVRARTREIEQQNQALAWRARQLQTVSEVARQIVSAQELEALLSSVTNLISERFGFYHVGVFLLDEKREYAYLRAANSEGGKRMLARHHMLPVGKVGIVGYVTGTGQPRIATDVGEDAVFFNNPDLPHTRSEMALPLKVGDQVIGALDIQSTESGAFHNEDIELFTTLADQVAIAIYNNQLYMETVRALEEANMLHRQYLQAEWAQDTARRKVLGYLYNQSGLSEQKTENPLWRKVFASGEPVYAMLPGGAGEADKAVMAVPISIRGETIGVIHVQDQGEDRLWSEDEIAVVNSIANQVAVALENARLFENTVRRAEREKKVLQITQKIRSTNNPDEMMRIAISELQQALRASRAQIYIRQSEAEQEDGKIAGNGHGG